MKTKVKICGITNIEDAICATELGADMLGFIFVPSSSRYVSADKASVIISKLPLTVQAIGVFADEERSEILYVINKTKITGVQLHGTEKPEDCSGFPCDAIKAFRVKDGFDHNVLKNYSASSFLLDTYSSNTLGGTGKTFDWNIAVSAKNYGRIILAGGLNPENIAEAVKIVQPYAVDVNSGVEISPGKKDKQKLKLLFDNMKIFK
jgi:phosphoribosylanthranilate isomerase